MKSYILRIAKFTLALALISLAPAVTPEIEILSFEMTGSEELIVTFADDGSGEIEDFGADYSTDLKNWTEIGATRFTPTGSGEWSAQIPINSANRAQFFRITKDGVALTASFSVPVLSVQEGDGGAGINVDFNRSFTGTLRYEIDGTPGSMELINATSTRIAIPTDGHLDDDEPGPMRAITLNLELEGGGATMSYVLGVNSSTTVLIEDNDSLWSGIMKLPNKGGEVGIRILRTENDGVVTTCFKTDKGGLIPTAPAGTAWLFHQFDLTLEANTFAAAVSGVEIPAESTIYGAATEVSITFTASGDGNVSADQIKGEFVLSTNVPGKPHLNISDREGSFTLIRRPGLAGESSAPIEP